MTAMVAKEIVKTSFYEPQIWPQMFRLSVSCRSRWTPYSPAKLGQLADNIQWRKPRGLSVVCRCYGDFVVRSLDSDLLFVPRIFSGMWCSNNIHLYCLFHPLFIVFYCRNIMIFKLSAIVPLSSYFDEDINVLFIHYCFMLVVLWINRLVALSRLSPWVDGTDDTETGLTDQRQALMWLSPLVLAHLITFLRAPV